MWQVLKSFVSTQPLVPNPLQAYLRAFAVFLPKDNELPTSMGRCNTILGVRKLEEVHRDACVCGAWSYDPKGPPATREDTCPKCSHPRFKPDDGSGKLIPFWVRYCTLSAQQIVWLLHRFWVFHCHSQPNKSRHSVGAMHP